MTTIFYIRHAECNSQNHDDVSRELTPKGLTDSKLVTRFLADKNVDIIFSSPYKRAIETLRDFSKSSGLEINTLDDLRERTVNNSWIEDFDFAAFSKAQWADFDYKLSGGESLHEVQARNIAALGQIIKEHKDRTVAIGTHATALGTVINFYDKKFDFAHFEKVKGLMPWIVKFSFQDDICKTIRKYNLFELQR